MAPDSFGTIAGLLAEPLELAGLLDEIPIPLVVIDPDRLVLFANSAFGLLTGCERDDLRGVPCRDVLRVNVCLDKCPALKAGECNAPVSLEGDIINRARAKIPVRLTAGRLLDACGRVAGYVETVEESRAAQRSGEGLREMDGLGNVVGMSTRMKELFRLIPVVAQADSSVLLTGETGTGKDVLAEMIHNASDRAEGAFVKINCGALPETLLESELFGHKKGAFTGAASDKLGRLRMAHNGTLYLTEIGDLPLPLQVKLLTFLDDKIVYPLGDTVGFRTDVRVVAATHRNLEQMVKDGEFRQDLLFRLNVVRLHIPPLREREGDISLLLDHFRTLYSSRFGKPIRGFSNHARQLLLSYAYPGNVRELRNIVEYAASICQSESITIEHLPRYLLDNDWQSGAGKSDESTPTESTGVRENATHGVASVGSSWAAVERQLILDALSRAHGRRGKAAELLGWARTTLWRKMKQHGL